jgi:hypothetical protein
MPKVDFDKLKVESFKEIKSDINFKDVQKYVKEQIYEGQDAIYGNNTDAQMGALIKKATDM